MSGLAAQQAEFMAMLYSSTPPADTRRAIYHGALRGNWLKALATAYPVVQRLVGDAFFAALANDYVRGFPSRSGDLNQLGASLAEFLREFEPAAVLAYLPDVARLEWALHEASFAGDAPRFDFAALARVPHERQGDIELQLAPWARLLESSHPVIAIWEANQADRDGTPEPAGEGGVQLLVLREDFMPRPLRLSSSEWLVLSAISRGEKLAAIVASLGDDATSLEPVLTRHASKGVVCGFRPLL